MLKIRVFSLNIKVFLSFLALGFFLLTVLFLLIIPKMQNEQYQHAKNQMERMVQLTKEQVSVAGKAIDIQSTLEKQNTKYKIELDIAKNNILPKECISSTIPFNNKIELNRWTKSVIYGKSFNKRDYYNTIYTDLVKTNKILKVQCPSSIFNKNHSAFEKDIKTNVQKAFALMTKIHKGTSYLIWINKKYQNDNSPLFTDDDTLRKDKYTISNMSNVKNIYTSTLSPKVIIENSDKEPLFHKLNNKDALTWTNIISENEKTYFILITTAYKNNFDSHIDSIFWKILPASLIALFCAILAGFFILKRLFKGINILAKTAKDIHKDSNVRSNVKGKDDIGYLGIAFDSMLDSMQNNIKNLDLKVQSKTKELQSSVEEKEILLKEIHHRVKNNLALTISLIKLQQYKVEDNKTKNILKDIQERIYTMELLHRKLYESKNLNLISVKEYIESLVVDISKTYTNISGVQIDFDIDEIYCDIETVLPCALIINEITTNAFKYAFVNHDNPILNITVKKEDKTYALCIRDNGLGIPDEIDIYKTNTLGLKLINSISKRQLRGEFEYKYDNGAVFIIRF